MNKMLLTTLFAAAAHLAPTVCAAAEYPLPQLPDGVMPNTEVSTNLPLHVKAEKLREFALTLNAASCTSNEVLVAIGCDARRDLGRSRFGRTPTRRIHRRCRWHGARRFRAA